MVLCVSLLTLSATVMADNDKPIKLSQMPKTAQQFIKQHFGGQKVAYAKMESDWSKNYEVGFANGEKIDFDKKGNWTEVECKHSVVPAGVGPEPIVKYLATHYTDRKITGIERNEHGYEVKLDNGLEMKFTKEYRLTELGY